jgi:hypothetical protein
MLWAAEVARRRQGQVIDHIMSIVDLQAKYSELGFDESALQGNLRHKQTWITPILQEMARQSAGGAGAVDSVA